MQNMDQYQIQVKMTRKKILTKQPPKDFVRSLQLNLFGQFITNDKSEVSNTTLGDRVKFRIIEFAVES